MWNQEDSRHSGPKPAPPADLSAPIRKASDGTEIRVATVGRSVVVKGDISGSEDLTIDGQVEGRISLPQHTLTVGPNATVRADVSAKFVTIFGTLVGDVNAAEKVDVRRGGTVEGHISCKSLAVQDGAVLGGKIETRSERRPARDRKESAEGSGKALAPVA
jgi:cytoskeletal protein CcmA (bactofilin family)